MSFADRADAYRERIEHSLNRWLPAATQNPAKLHEAMRYATLGGGKRLRPLIVYAVGETLGIDAPRLDGPACALELIHAYSLVHDDLPAMDDDDLRRGRPSCHKAFDEATAVLTGDALQTLAFEVLCRDKDMTDNPAARLKMVRTLSQASGSHGMAGGQAMDLAVTGTRPTIAELEDLHIHKTGALIRAAASLACDSADACTADHREALEHYAKCIGLAFQIQDDILDEESDTATLGKTQGADRDREQPTFPSIIGLEESKLSADELIRNALDSLKPFGDKAEPLRWLAAYVIQRNH